jgi:hypothetical protein
MLDWTTSFLSDALIIKPEIAICQTLSLGIQHVGEAVGVRLNWWTVFNKSPVQQQSKCKSGCR